MFIGYLYVMMRYVHFRKPYNTVSVSQGASHVGCGSDRAATNAAGR